MIKLKRAYEKPSRDDGLRILVERLWPRGLTKERAAVDLWLKDVAPSPELRKWFDHDPDKWEQFQKRYWKELEKNVEAVRLLKQKGKQGTITLVYGARDEEHNSALALKQFLEGHTSAQGDLAWSRRSARRTSLLWRSNDREPSQHPLHTPPRLGQTHGVVGHDKQEVGAEDHRLDFKDRLIDIRAGVNLAQGLGFHDALS